MWDLIGGDPAPGSTDAVANASVAFLRVADLADETGRSLVEDTSALGVERWTGSAAKRFREDVGELPARLGEVETSYRQAGVALRTYRDRLDDAQYRARTALKAAEQAEGDRRRAQQRLDAARMDADSLRGQRRSADGQLLAAQARQAVTIDPAARAGVDSAAAAARARANRLRAEVQAAERTAERYQDAVREAEGRLARARQDADRIRDDLERAVEAAVGELGRAVESGDLPNFLERFAADAKETFQELAPVLVQTFKLGQTLFSIAAVLFPPGAVIFTGLALGFGVLALATSIADTALSDEGFTGDKLMELGVMALGVAVNATAFGAATKLAGAARLAQSGQTALANQAIGGAQRLKTATEWLENAEDAAVFGRDVVQDGVASAVESYVVGKATTVLAGAALQGTIAAANRAPVLRDALTGMSRTLSDTNPNPNTFGVGLDELPNARGTQSLLGTGQVPPGGFLPGNAAATAPSILDHALSRPQLDGFARDVVEPGVDQALDAMEERAEERAAAREPEIDIDLNPSTYGGTR